MILNVGVSWIRVGMMDNCCSFAPREPLELSTGGSEPVWHRLELADEEIITAIPNTKMQRWINPLASIADLQSPQTFLMKDPVSSDSSIQKPSEISRC